MTVWFFLQTNTVESVSSDGYTITLATPLSHTHHGVTETFENGHFIDIRYATYCILVGLK